MLTKKFLLEQIQNLESICAQSISNHSRQILELKEEIAMLRKELNKKADIKKPKTEKKKESKKIKEM